MTLKRSRLRAVGLAATTVLVAGSIAGTPTASAQPSTPSKPSGSSEPATSATSQRAGSLGPLPHDPAHEKAYVAFGDSFSASTRVDGFRMRRATACSVGHESFPEILARTHFGGDIGNASCDGGTISTPPPFASLYSEYASVAGRGWIGPRTKLVTIMVGGNEPWLLPAPGWANGALTGDIGLTKKSYLRRIGPAVAAIKASAPNARVLLVTYPHVAENHRICAANLDVTINAPLPTNLDSYLDSTARLAEEAAPELGVEAVDMRRPGTGSCAPAGKRWVRTFYDTRDDSNVLAFHPTPRGANAMASIVWNAYRR